MSRFVCQNLQYILSGNVASITGNTITPSNGYSLIPVNFNSKAEFVETAKEKNGNIYYEQSLEITLKYTLISEITALHEANLIVELKKPDDTVFAWGSIMPLNPVRCTFETQNGFAYIKFSRLTSLNEF